MPRRPRLLLALGLALALLVPPAVASGQEPEAGPGPDGEIVGGQPADPGEYPFQVGLLRRGVANRFLAQFCGGSLISPDTVLTAAHCVEGETARTVDVLVGTHTLAHGGGGARVPARRIRTHPGYLPTILANDLAIIQLGGQHPQAPIRTVQPNDGLFGPGDPATVTGWGALSENGNQFPLHLREVAVPVLSNAQCADRYGSDFRALLMLCAGDLADGGEDSCQGDSGGPLFVDDGGEPVQIGIVSWGVGCARAQRPGVYTRVTRYAGFINPYLDPDSPPNAPTHLRARKVAPRASLVRWRPPVFDGGTRITRYRVTVPALGRNHGVLGNQTLFRLRNLPPGRHRVVIRAVNGIGPGTPRALFVRV